MLVIRQEQIDQLIAADDEQLSVVVAGAVRAADPERVAPYEDDELAGLVRGGIKRARSHGFTAYPDIAAFVAIMFAVAPRFDEQPDIKAVLDESPMPHRMRIALACESVLPDAWSEAEKRYEDSFWFPG